MLQERTCIHRHRVTGKEAQPAAITLTVHRGELKNESSSCQSCIAGLEPFLGKSRVIAGFSGLCLLVKLSVNYSCNFQCSVSIVKLSQCKGHSKTENHNYDDCKGKLHYLLIFLLKTFHSQTP